MKKNFKISYTYDCLNRLSTVTLNGENRKCYAYDPAGNLVAISPHAPENSKESLSKGERFADLEEEYARLNDLAQAGSLSLEELQEEVNRLRFQDAGGTWWQLRFDGIWLKWDGTSWVEAEPTP